MPLSRLFSASIAACCSANALGVRPLATVSDCEWSPMPRYFKPSALRRLGHLLQRVGAVAVGRVAVEDAVDVVDLDQVRQRVVLGGLDLAGVLAHLRRDVIQAERLEEVGLVLARDALVRAGQFVLVELQAAVRWPRCRMAMLCSLLPVK